MSNISTDHCFHLCLHGTNHAWFSSSVCFIIPFIVGPPEHSSYLWMIPYKRKDGCCHKIDPFFHGRHLDLSKQGKHSLTEKCDQGLHSIKLVMSVSGLAQWTARALELAHLNRIQLSFFCYEFHPNLSLLWTRARKKRSILSRAPLSIHLARALISRSQWKHLCGHAEPVVVTTAVKHIRWSYFSLKVVREKYKVV